MDKNQIEKSSKKRKRRWKVWILLLIFSFFLEKGRVSAEECNPILQEPEKTKNKILQCEKLLQEISPEKKGEIYVLLAQAYLKEQEFEKSLQVFLEALKEDSHKSQSIPTDEEKKLFDEALQIYLDHDHSTAIKNAEKILKNYGSVVDKNPSYYLLNFLTSISLANLNLYSPFFLKFFQSFQHYPDHYLVYKTKAILHIKLFLRARTEELREKEKEKIADNILKAIEKFPGDSTLYRPLMAFAPSAKKKELIGTYLKKMLNIPIVIPRADLAFYIQQAQSVEENALADEIIQKAKVWYPNSRTVDAAEKILKNEKG